jgi:hypothetical protein
MRAITLLFIFLFSFIIFYSTPAIQLTGIALAQEPEKRLIEAHPIDNQQIKVDGELNEEVWKSYAPISGFIQQEPKMGEKEVATTQVWILYDSANLYIGANLIDPEPGEVRGDERHRDADFSRSDTFALVIDSFHDHQNGFFFETNLLGGKSDALVHQEGAFVNSDWDGLWDVAAAKTITGWSLEIKIPFETLKYQPGQADTWGIQFRRKIPHLKEVSFWSPATTDQNIYMLSGGGHLMGIHPEAIGRQIFINPYVKGGLQLNQRDPAGKEGTGDAGFDLIYKFKTNLTLDLTYHTDFAETETDRLQVNLTRFPLFFPEKRTFFLEGSDYFDFGLSGRVQPFFSRSIGLERGQPLPLIGGIKLTGKTDAYGLGLLSIGSRSDKGLEGEEMSAVRLTRDIGLRSRLGLLLTDRTGPYGSDQTGGFDFTAGPLPELDFQGFWIRSGWPNPSPGGDGAAQFAEAYWHDPLWRIRLNHLRISDGFNPSLGFVQQADLDETYGYIDLHPRPETGPVREYGFKGELTYQNDSKGSFLYRSNYWRAQASFRSGDFILLSFDPQIEHLPVDFQIRPGIIIPTGNYSYQQYSEIFQSDPRRKLSVVQTWYFGEFYNGEKHSVTLGFTWGVVETLKLGLSVEQDWVNLPAGNFVAETIDQEIRWDMTNQMNIQTMTQWDKESEQLSANLRFSWEYQPGSFFYFIVNPVQTDPRTRFLFLAKLTYLFRL